MATYNLDSVAGAVALEINNPQLANRWERHYNVLAQAGLAVGDVLYADLVVPLWVRTIVASKRTDTSNADVLTVAAQVPGLPIQPVLPIKTAPSVQTGGSTSNAAANAVLMQLFPLCNQIRLSLTLAGSVPTKCLLSVAFYDY